MAKKINTFGATVKTLLLKGYSQSWIALKLKVKRQRVNYWATHPLKTEQTKKRKLPDNYKQKIFELVKYKIKKIFFLNKKQRDERVKFCKMILEKEIKGEQIFFTDETKIEMGAYINDHIRLPKNSKKN